MSQTPQRPLPNGLRAVPAFNARPRRATSLTRDASIAASLGAPAQPGEDEEREDDPIHTMLKARCAQTEMSIAGLFAPGGGQRARSARSSPSRDHGSDQAARPEDNAKPSAPPKKAARTIEDDYGDDDDEDEEEESEQQSPLKSKGKAVTTNGVSAPAVRSPMPPIARTNTNTSSDQSKSSEDVRKQLDEDKRAAAENAKRAFQEMFFTFENDRAAMLEQQKLDELDREVENEISGDPNASPNA